MLTITLFMYSCQEIRTMNNQELGMRNFSEREFGRIFCGNAAKNRAFRGCAIAPAPALRAVAASHPSNPLRGPGAFCCNPGCMGEQRYSCLRISFVM
jgi:hypothetical protein